MASDANETNANANSQQDNTHADDAAHREAYDFWGYLIKPDKCGTELFNRLLEGVAEVISKNFEPSSSPDLTPSQIAAFYRAVGGNYDVLFLETPPSSISFIYRSLGAFHSLQPAPDDDGYSSPTIPALKKKGFVMWQTIQLLLGPEEHVDFLQSAVREFDVVDKETGSVFPKILPRECLPRAPDDAMETWYEGVAERLKGEAEDDKVEQEGKEKGTGPSVHVKIDDHGPRTSSEMSDGGSADERRAAAKYFSDPLYKKGNRRPPILRHFSKEGRDGRRWGPHEEEVGKDKDRGRLISSVRHMLNPFGRDRRRSFPTGRYGDDGYSDNDATPIAPQPPQAPRYTAHTPHPTSSHKRPHPMRRESTLSSTDSDSDSDQPPSRRRTPVLRQRRSHDPPSSTSREYFPQYYEDRRYSHDVSPLMPSRKEDGPPPLYGPTKAPIFATHVAQMQAHNHNYYSSSDTGHAHRPSMPPRTSYRPSPPTLPSFRYAAPPEVHEPPYVRERERERDRDRERERERGPYSPQNGHSRHRRRSEDTPSNRERRADLGERTRSHDRVRDEWDDGDDRARGGSRDVSRNGREGGSGGRRLGTHRYVPGVVQDGVRGRKYPVEQPWR